MTVVAGIDVGNSTTEIVIAQVRAESIRVVCSGTAMTQGAKGSAASLRRASHLLQRLEYEHATTAEIVAMARFQPVVTELARLPLAPSRGRLMTIITRAQTPSGQGLAVGRHVPLAKLPETGGPPLVVSVPDDIDFADAAARINAAAQDGLDVVGVLCEADEAVLIGNRLERSVPILDEVPLAQLAPGELVLLEVAPPGGHVRALADPVTLAHLAGLPSDAVNEAVDVASRHAESRAALVRRDEETPGREGADAGAWVECLFDGDLRRLPLGGDVGELARVTPGSVRALQLPRSKQGQATRPDRKVRDVFAPDLPRLERQPIVRRGSIDVRAVPLSVLKEGAPGLTSPLRLSRLLARRVVVEVDEPAAAFRGAMTTPGAPDGAVVCDIGAGTINVVDGSRSVTVAGAGDLLTLSIASVLDISASVAEHIKRHTSVKVMTPHLVHDESGIQRFSDHVIGGDMVGTLCAEAPTGLLPFDVRLSPEEWRGLRLSLKMEVTGVNLDRALGMLQGRPAALLLCGGGALDPELMRSVSDTLAGGGIAVGRADVAGLLGPRYAVAFGLVLSHALHLGEACTD